jgi:hypothetical protein
MLGLVIRTPLLDRMSIQLQFTLGNNEKDQQKYSHKCTWAALGTEKDAFMNRFPLIMVLNYMNYVHVHK